MISNPESDSTPRRPWREPTQNSASELLEHITSGAAARGEQDYRRGYVHAANAIYRAVESGVTLDRLATLLDVLQAWREQKTEFVIPPGVREAECWAAEQVEGKPVEDEQ